MSEPADDDDDRIGYDLSEDETDALLGSKGHGVLSLANDGRGYGVPISYGYDPDDGRVLFEFLGLGGGKKGTFVGTSNEVTLTVYTFESSDRWESVIVTGMLREVDPADFGEGTVERLFSQFEDAAERFRWEEADRDDRQWYELEATSITGRHRGDLLHE